MCELLAPELNNKNLFSEICLNNCGLAELIKDSNLVAGGHRKLVVRVNVFGCDPVRVFRCSPQNHVKALVQEGRVELRIAVQHNPGEDPARGPRRDEAWPERGQGGRLEGQKDRRTEGQKAEATKVRRQGKARRPELQKPESEKPSRPKAQGKRGQRGQKARPKPARRDGHRARRPRPTRPEGQQARRPEGREGTSQTTRQEYAKVGTNDCFMVS